MQNNSMDPAATSAAKRRPRRWAVAGGVLAAAALTFVVGLGLSAEQSGEPAGAPTASVERPSWSSEGDAKVGPGGAVVGQAALDDDGGAEQTRGLLDVSDGSVDGPTGEEVAADPPPFEITQLGTQVTLSPGVGWGRPTRNRPGEIIFTFRKQSTDGWNRRVVLLRPHVLVDPAEPQAFGAQSWSVHDIEGWLDEIIDGVVSSGPEQVEIGGHDAVYFEVEVDPAICGSATFCAGFVANTFEPGPENGGEGRVSGWAFTPRLHDRIWWIDQGDEPPLVIIAQTAVADRSFQPNADALLETIVIGEAQPHPVPFEASGLAG